MTVDGIYKQVLILYLKVRRRRFALDISCLFLMLLVGLLSMQCPTWEVREVTIQRNGCLVSVFKHDFRIQKLGVTLKQ